MEGGHNYPFLIRLSERKPIRAFLQDGSRDLDNPFGNWFLDNQQMAAALKFKGYDVQWHPGEGFHRSDQLRSIFDQVGPLDVDDRKLAALCHRWKIAKLEAFGSVLCDDFRAGSDVEILVRFEDDSLPAGFGIIEAERSELFGRSVDLVPREGLMWVIWDQILAEANPVFSA